MNLVADESVDGQIVQHLRAAGHVLHFVAESQPGAPDELVAETARKEEAVLLTADKDFGELFYRQGLASHGVILLRLAGLSSESKPHLVLAAITEHLDQLPRAFTVISPGAVRIRPPLG